MLLLKTIVKAAILPPGSILLLFVLSFVLRKKHPRASKRIALGAFLAFYLLSTPLVSYGLNRLVEQVPPASIERVEEFKPQAIVVLGGGGDAHAPEYRDGPSCSEATLARVTHGAYWAKRTELPILVSGGLLCDHGHTEAQAMNFALGLYGLSPKWKEEQSRNTHENAVFSQQFLAQSGVERILLVTSSYHAQRAENYFRTSGLEVLSAPTQYADPDIGLYNLFGILPDFRDLQSSSRAVRDLIALLVQKF